MKQWENADYWQDDFTGRTTSDIEDAYTWIKQGNEVTGIFSKLLLSESNGVHIPRIFAENFDLWLS